MRGQAANFSVRGNDSESHQGLDKVPYLGLSDRGEREGDAT